MATRERGWRRGFSVGLSLEKSGTWVEVVKTFSRGGRGTKIQVGKRRDVSCTRRKKKKGLRRGRLAA